MIASAPPSAPTVTPPPGWLVALLRQLAPPAAVDALLATHPADLWDAADSAGLATTSTILDALARRTQLRVARQFPVTDALRATLPETLARRFHVVPTAASPSTG